LSGKKIKNAKSYKCICKVIENCKKVIPIEGFAKNEPTGGEIIILGQR